MQDALSRLQGWSDLTVNVLIERRHVCLRYPRRAKRRTSQDSGRRRGIQPQNPDRKVGQPRQLILAGGPRGREVMTALAPRHMAGAGS
jgi:hypothetical protein